MKPTLIRRIVLSNYFVWLFCAIICYTIVVPLVGIQNIFLKICEAIHNTWISYKPDVSRKMYNKCRKSFL